MPVLERVDGRSALEDGLRQLAVVEADIAQDGLLQVLAAAETMALQNVLDPAVEPLDHTIIRHDGVGASAPSVFLLPAVMVSSSGVRGIGST